MNNKEAEQEKPMELRGSCPNIFRKFEKTNSAKNSTDNSALNKYGMGSSTIP